MDDNTKDINQLIGLVSKKKDKVFILVSTELDRRRDISEDTLFKKQMIKVLLYLRFQLNPYQNILHLLFLLLLM